MLGGERQFPPPIWLMRQAGRYLPEYRELRGRVGSFLELCYTPELAAEVTLQPIRRFGFDAAILFSDILTIADGLGQKVEFAPSGGPVLAAIRSEGELLRLDAGRVRRHLAPVLETVRLVKAALPEACALIGFAGAPWTVASYMVEGGGGTDFSAARRFAREQPKIFARLIDLLLRSIADHLIDQIDAGAECVQLFDSWAGLLDADEFDRHVIAPMRDLVARIKLARPGVPVIGFPRGAGPHYADYARRTGVDAVSVDQKMALAWARDELGARVALQGNLDPAALVTGGAALDAGIDAILRTWKSARFVFNLGHGVLPETPPEHVAHLVARVRAADAEGSA